MTRPNPDIQQVRQERMGLWVLLKWQTRALRQQRRRNTTLTALVWSLSAELAQLTTPARTVQTLTSEEKA